MDTDLLRALTTGIEAVLPEAASLRRAIHADPHLGGDEQDTRDALTDALDWLAWEPVAETGAFARTSPDGPAIGLRAELDALPITEATGVAWSSQRRGLMHACGHDVHMAALWAFLRAAREVELPVAAAPLLQPREEVYPSGASDVVASGLLEDADIRAMVGVHVQPQVEAGVLSTGSGPVNAAYDMFSITVHGRGGHGAYPHLAVDPITVLATILSGLQQAATRVVDPTRPSVISVGTISGGTAPNVFAATATCTGTLRAFHESDRLALHQAVETLAEGTALAHGVRATVEFDRGGPALVNDAGLVTATDALLAGAGVQVTGAPFRSCGSDDFSEYSAVVPSLMCFVGTGAGDGVGLHHARFLPGRQALRLCALAYAASYVAAAGSLA